MKLIISELGILYEYTHIINTEGDNIVKQTGVFRRIDDLGRIVIPKEIRKSLNIKDGESLEIYTNNDTIVLKKYSLMSDLILIAQNCSDSYYDVIKKNIIITDRDKIIAASGNLRKKYKNCEISTFLSNLILKRQLYIDNSNDETELLKNHVVDLKYVVSPVLLDGDTVGSVIILSEDNICDIEKKCAIFISKFLGKHLE